MPAGAQSLVYSPKGDRIAVLGRREGKLWDAENAREIATLVGHRDHPDSLIFTPDGSSVLLLEGQVFIFDSKTGKQTGAIGKTPMASISISSDSQRLVGPSAGNNAIIINAKTGETIATLSGHAKAVKLAHFTPDGGDRVRIYVRMGQHQ